MYKFIVIGMTVLLIGCSNTNSQEEETPEESTASESSEEKAVQPEPPEENTENNSEEQAAEKVNEGQGLIEEGELTEAQARFEEALTHEEDQEEALEWLQLLEERQSLQADTVEKNWPSARETVETMQASAHYPSIEPYIEEELEALALQNQQEEEVEEQIAYLYSMYDPDDPESIPNEAYAHYTDQALEMPGITEEQKQEIEDYKTASKERGDEIVAQMAEEEMAYEEEEPAISAEEAFDIMYEYYDHNPETSRLHTQFEENENGDYVFMINQIMDEGEEPDEDQQAAAGTYIVDSETGEVKLAEVE